MNWAGGLNDLRGDFVWLHGSRRVAEIAEENKPNGGLRALCHDVAGLRRGEHLAERLRLERQRLEQFRSDRAGCAC
jgi:hypothetical protein